MLPSLNRLNSFQIKGFTNGPFNILNAGEPVDTRLLIDYCRYPAKHRTDNCSNLIILIFLKNHQLLYFDRISVPLVPPKPKELVIAFSTVAWRTSLGT